MQSDSSALVTLVLTIVTKGYQELGFNFPSSVDHSKVP